jgi:ubiquinone/menaquinone biosynthesis C-methylase UbiE
MRIFDDDFVLLAPERTKRELRREIEFIEQALGVNPGSLVLDLACGIGTQAVALAKRNYRIVGVDLSLSMLARAGEQAQEAGQKINFIHGDMRDLGFDRTFDAVYCIGTSFGYFDEETNRKVLEGVYRSLKPGGAFLLEVINRDFVIGKQPNLTWFQGRDVVCMEETNFNYINSRLYVSRQLILGAGARQSKHEYSLRIYSLHEIGLILHSTGFTVNHVSGNLATPGVFFGSESPRLIIRAERPA